MENKILDLIINTRGLALVLAILFYYSLYLFRQHAKERIKLCEELFLYARNNGILNLGRKKGVFKNTNYYKQKIPL